MQLTNCMQYYINSIDNALHETNTALFSEIYCNFIFMFPFTGVWYWLTEVTFYVDRVQQTVS